MYDIDLKFVKFQSTSTILHAVKHIRHIYVTTIYQEEYQ